MGPLWIYGPKAPSFRVFDPRGVTGINFAWQLVKFGPITVEIKLVKQIKFTLLRHAHSPSDLHLLFYHVYSGLIEKWKLMAGLYRINKPLSGLLVSRLIMSLAERLSYFHIVLLSHLPSQFCFSAKCSFFGQSLSRGHYQPTYQPPEEVYLLKNPEKLMVYCLSSGLLSSTIIYQVQYFSSGNLNKAWLFDPTLWQKNI